MLITPSNIDSMFQGFRVLFNSNVEAAPQLKYKLFAQEEDSDGESETYSFAQRNGRMREWIGDRLIDGYSAHGFTIRNLDFERTIGLDRNKIEDDKYKTFRSDVADLAQTAAEWPDDLILSLIEAGDSALCFDGQNFFDTDHPVNLYNNALGTQANLLTSSPLTQANYFAAKAAFKKFKRPDGTPYELVPDVLLVPDELEQKAREIMTATTILQNGTGSAAPANVAMGDCRVVTWSRLTSPTTWYLLCTTRAVKPFIFQRRKAPELVIKNSANDDNVFFGKQLLMGVDSRGNAGYSLPALAFQMNA